MATLRPMYMSDLVVVTNIIDAHDDDDAQAAQSDYQSDGVENQFVLEQDEKVIGVTGYRSVDATDGTYWLSWTYLEPSQQGKGLGKAMLEQLTNKLRELKARKLFVKVSDYKTPENKKSYENAFFAYQSFGFVEQVINNDFYDEGENQHILSYDFAAKKPEDSSGDTDTTEPQLKVADEKPIIQFSGLFEIAETDGAFSFEWEVKATKKLFGKRNFTVEDLQIGMQAAQEQGARKIFLTFPSNLPLIHKPLQGAGFEYVGCLSDYYEAGIHEYHFVYSF